MKINIAPFLRLIEIKYKRNQERENEVSNGLPRSHWNEAQTYVDLMKQEIEEMHSELKKDNTIYLEEELGDIFWDYLNLIHILKEKGYIESYTNIFKASRKKFKARIHGDLKWFSWQDIKKKQKQENKKKHTEKYGT